MDSFIKSISQPPADVKPLAIPARVIKPHLFLLTGQVKFIYR